MTLTAMLLAGGRSQRMGRDKVTMTFDDQPLWQRQLQLLRKISPTTLWVSARTRPAWCPLDVEIVLDDPPSQGPLSGLTPGLRRLQTSHLLVLAIDLPRVSPEHLRKLWSLTQPGKAIIPFNGDYFEPLCAIYPAEAAPIAQEVLNGGDFSLQHFARTLVNTSRGHAYPLSQNERSLYLNLNTPEDLSAKG